jgi:hypothetical protein
MMRTLIIPKIMSDFSASDRRDRVRKPIAYISLTVTVLGVLAGVFHLRV